MILHPDRRLFAYYPPDRHSRFEIVRNCVSLEKLLSQTQLRPYQSLDLAVNLASSLLQLHATPWLPVNWCESSIYFPHNVPTVEINQPYVIINFGESPVSSNPDDTLNPYLVSLGIILLELLEGKTFFQWLSERNDINIQTDDIKDRASAAWKWLTENAKLRFGGETYHAVVKRCLQCSFASIQPQKYQKNLCDETFRDAFYREVVHELKSIYRMTTSPINL